MRDNATMRKSVLSSTLALLSFATMASAGSNSTSLVPAYEPCTPPATTCPAVLESRFTFESAKLKTPKSEYLKDNKTAVTIELKGVRDPTGSLVTTDEGNQADDFKLFIPGTQVTIGGTTTAPGILSPDIVVGIDLKNGKGKASYKTPAGGEGTGLVAEAVGVPYVVDSDGNRFAVSGSRDKPSK
jgi:hypothetical protein